VTVIATPTITANSVSICAGRSYTLSATGATSYTYSTGNPVVSPALTSSYTIVGSNSLGCISNSVTVTVSVNPQPSITISNGSVCLGSSYVLNPTGAATFTYSSGSATITPTASANYSITGTTSAGCVSPFPTIVFIAVNPTPDVLASSTKNVLCIGETATLSVTGADTYTWEPASNDVSIAINPTVTTTYTVTGTDSNGCEATSVITQSVDACTGIAKDAQIPGFMVYPNPTNGELTVEVQEASTLSLVNALGQLVMTERLSEGRNRIVMGDQANGIYFAIIKHSDQTRVVKVVKE
jgi:hypothetical protein